MTESRILSFGGEALSNYPIVRESMRGHGRAETTFRQIIPDVASAGIYTFRGEVCVGGDCISRSVTLEVMP